VALRLGPLKLTWLGKNSHKDDPYWDFFINTPPADLANTVTEMIRNAPEGNVFPTKAELHTPEITSSHVKGMAQYFGAELVGITKLPLNEDLSPRRLGREGKVEVDEAYPFAIICAVHADYNPRKAPGIGGQVPVQNGLFISFVLSAWIRELGFRASAAPDPDAEKLAAAAGLGTLNQDGRLVTPQFGTNVHVANVIRTDLPMAPDG
jgi:epoxyqueuosine reductase